MADHDPVRDPSPENRVPENRAPENRAPENRAPEDRAPESCYWAASAPPPPALPRLSGEAEAEIAVVGGGYTGLVTALLLAERGHAVALLEAREIGHGGSGRNAGHCTPTFHLASPDQIRRAFGPTFGPRIVALQTGAAARVAALIARHGIDCDFVQRGYLRAAHAPSRMAELEVKCRTYRALGLSGELLDAAAAQRLAGSPRPYGGWLLHDGAHLHPLKFARGLAAAAQRSGAALYVDSPVRGLARRPDGRPGWQLDTPHGRLRARRVLLATGAYLDGRPWRRLEQAVSQVHIVGLASAPLPGGLRAQVLAGDQTFTDTRKDPFIYKWTADNRLVTTVYRSPRLGRDPALTRAYVAERTAWLFPEVGRVDWPHLWPGKLDVQRRTFPRVFALEADLFACLGYSGRGVPTATALAGELAALLGGAPPDELAVPLERFEAGRRALDLLGEPLMAAWRLRDRLIAWKDGVREPDFLALARSR